MESSPLSSFDRICCLNSDCHNPPCCETDSVCPSCNTPLVDLQDRYSPIEPIGAGGFGKTYLARDLKSDDRLCVIKQFAPQTTDEWAIAKAQELFEREAMGLQRLGVHPQIPSLLDYFEAEGNLYLIQEYIEGRTLKEELKIEGIFDESKIIQVMADLLDILAFVHRHSVIHRDIKPQNIMRRSIDRKIILIDFGVSKQMTLTTIGKPATLIGSSGYVPREQMETGDVSSNCDLYAVGATCFHLISGVSPRQLVRQEGYYWVQRWRQHLSQPVSKKLSFIFDKLLQVESRRRYQLVEQVLTDLRELSRSNSANDRTAVSIPVGEKSEDNRTAIAPDRISATIAAEKTPNKRSDKIRLVRDILGFTSPLVLKICGGTTLLFLLLAITQVYNYSRYRLFPSNPLYAITAPPSSVFLQRTLKNDRSWVNVLYNDNRSQSLFSGSESGAIEQWDAVTGKLIKTWQPEGKAIVAMAGNESGKVLATGDKQGTIAVWDLKEGKIKNSFKIANSRIISLSLAKDSNSAILATESIRESNSIYRIDIWNLTAGKISRTLVADREAILSLALSRDDRYLVTSGLDGKMNIWDVSTAKLVKTLQSHSGYIEAIDITPDSKWLVSGSADRSVKIWNLATGELTRTLTGHDDRVKKIAISPNGEIVATAGVDRQIRLWEMSTGKLITTYLGHNSSIRSLAISADGKTLASGGVDRPIEIWRVP